MGTYGSKHTEETKRKISEARKKYLNEHPDKVPFKLNHSSKESYPEKYFKAWLKKEKIFEVQELQIDRYTLDFAWPDKKIYLEIDGSQHKLDWMQEHDRIRTEYLDNLGWKCIGRVYWPDYQALSKIEKHCYLLVIKDAIINSAFIEKFVSKKEQKQLKKEALAKQGRVNSLGRVTASKLDPEIWAKRLSLILNSQVDFSKQGWQEAVQKITGLSRPQVRDTIKHYPEHFNKAFIRGRTKRESDNSFKIQADKANKEREQLILKSNINFNAPGWLASLARLLNVSHQSVKKWLIRHMPDFYNSCYKKSQ